MSWKEDNWVKNVSYFKSYKVSTNASIGSTHFIWRASIEKLSNFTYKVLIETSTFIQYSYSWYRDFFKTLQWNTFRLCSLVIYLESFILCNELISVTNVIQKFLLVFYVVFYLPIFVCIFFSYSGEGFFILYEECEENREIRNVRLIVKYLSVSGMLDRWPNLNDVGNTDISNSDLKIKWQGYNTIVDNESEKDNMLCIALYRYRTHIRTNFSFTLIVYTEALSWFLKAYCSLK